MSEGYINQRLRSWIEAHGDKLPPEPGVRRDMLLSAAEEIERLRALNAELVEALEAVETMWSDLALSSREQKLLNKVHAAIAKAKGET